MERDPEQKKEAPPEGNAPPQEEDTAGGRIPELLRRGLSLGFSGLFMTEEAVRRAFGDTVPRDWIDFATEQSTRTRSEFIERLSGEIARTTSFFSTPLSIGDGNVRSNSTVRSPSRTCVSVHVKVSCAIVSRRASSASSPSPAFNGSVRAVPLT